MWDFFKIGKLDCFPYTESWLSSQDAEEEEEEVGEELDEVLPPVLHVRMALTKERNLRAEILPTGNRPMRMSAGVFNSEEDIGGECSRSHDSHTHTK